VIAMLAALLIASPPPRSFDCDSGQTVCWFTRRGRRCTCEPDELRLGAWDPRPAPDEWPSNAYQSPPPDFGAYPLEKKELWP
jgi:hypothetical protein